MRSLLAKLTVIARQLLGLGFRFWLFIVGLALIAYGAAQVYAPAAPFLTGLILVWDATRPEPAQRR